ncbi:Ubiquitin-associated domain-containing protein 1 [Balamuthia mandrillaris]
MLLKVKTLVGKIHSLQVTAGSTVNEVKDRLHSAVPSIPRGRQTLVYKGKVVEDSQVLKDLDVHEGDFMVVFIGRKRPPLRLQEESLGASLLGEESPEGPSKEGMEIDKEQTLNDLVSSLVGSLSPQLARSKPASTSSSVRNSGEVRNPLRSSSSSSSSASSASSSSSSPVPKRKGNSATQSSSSSSSSSTSSSSSSTSSSSTSTTTTTSTTAVPPSTTEVPTARSTTRSGEARLPPVDPTALQMLADMGFPENRASKALLLHRMNAQAAMEWLLMHGEDQDIDAPLTEEQVKSLREEQRSFAPSSEAIRQLREMGFPQEDVTTALRMTRNNQEAALAWLLGDRTVTGDSESDRDDEEDSADEDEGDEIFGGGDGGGRRRGGGLFDDDDEDSDDTGSVEGEEEGVDEGTFSFSSDDEEAENRAERDEGINEDEAVAFKDDDEDDDTEQEGDERNTNNRRANRFHDGEEDEDDSALEEAIHDFLSSKDLSNIGGGDILALLEDEEILSNVKRLLVEGDARSLELLRDHPDLAPLLSQLEQMFEELQRDSGGDGEGGNGSDPSSSTSH